VAEWLEARDEVESVNYAGLPSSPWYARGKEIAPRGTGAVLSFEIKGGIEAGKKLVDALELHSHVANIGDVRSLVIHPASTTHRQLSDADKTVAGAGPDVVRISVGIEDVADIIADLDQALAAK
jgi:O-acetylhomoserine (thiol)-lyase